MRVRLLTATVLCAILGVAVLPAPGFAQFPPDSFTNLEVLPKDIDQGELIDLMVSFTWALGVRCTYCHVGEEGEPLATYDFPSDDKLEKRKARVMLRMLKHINSEHLAELEERVEPPVEVECATCHRGAPQPRMIQDILLAAYEAAGLDSAIATYESLREEYYGTFTYDFSNMVLADVAAEVGQNGQLGDAVRLYEMNVELFPNSVFVKRQHVGAALLLAFREEGVEAGTSLYRELRDRYPANVFPEFLLNRLGYTLLRGDRIEPAIAVFRLNVEAYPEAFNVYDSLGEAYMVRGDVDLAIENYERSLELNPGNANAVEKLKELKAVGGGQ